MSTHILGDAERVCDRVVILRAGEAVFSAAMDELRRRIAPHFDVDLALDAGEIEAWCERLRAQHWVLACAAEGSRIRVTVAEGDGAPLLRFLADAQLPVVRFEKGEASLEDLFLQVVKTA